MSESIKYVISTNKSIILETAGKYCDSDIKIIVEENGESTPVFQGKPIEVSTEEEMDNILSTAVSENEGMVYKYIGTTGDKYTNNTLYLLEVIKS